MSDPATSAVRVVVDVNLVRGILSERGGSAVLIRALKQGLLIPIASRPYLQEEYRYRLSTAAPPLSGDKQTAPATHCADEYRAERSGWSR